MPANMTWGAMVQRITDEMLRSTSADSDNVKKALISAMEYYQYDSLWFNQDTFTFSTTASTQDYGQESTAGAADGYPADFIRPLTMSLQDNSTWYEVPMVPIGYLRDYHVSDSFEGKPSYFAWHNKEIVFSPIPDAAYTVKVDAVKDIGIPYYTYSGGTYTFYNPATDVAIADSWTSDWMTHAEELIRTRAKIDINLNVLRNDADAQRQAMLNQKAWEKLKLNESMKFQMMNRIPWS